MRTKRQKKMEKRKERRECVKAGDTNTRTGDAKIYYSKLIKNKVEAGVKSEAKV